MKRELESLEEYMAQAAKREPGKQVALPRVSRLLDALATDNRLNLLQPDHRKHMRAYLLNTERHAPTIHISFATDPSSAFTAKIVTWLRASIAPNVLLEVGLQPTIAAGCVVRTTNKIFDLSLRQHFADAGNVLLESLEHMGGVAPATDAAAVLPPAAPAPTPAPAPQGAAQ
jgi:F0F1-type ATP synthase delta subunit